MRINTKAMKVAILSMQQIKNYGSFLQAFSLKKNIESLGHTCEFINIIPGEQLEGYKTSCFYNIKLLFQRLWGCDVSADLNQFFVGIIVHVVAGHSNTVVLDHPHVAECFKIIRVR